ncbi:sugar phosphate permease [Caldisphaera lagunensis DSM 15908]|uniref:Sugar phosphate permease n=1 Tax=Caldisphaera lagunensis (strain DSM 15908 / JCM 11604 / ANMR 0165 / IC-154) TaxID=1056495 RepID=L0A7T3_CALLD|nr:MFS transporter [Caldisphaera lagunensis]AFZ69933.1 sugar phosphate permease [Caldisphaera lagunensis DSM 15908]
MKKSLIIFITSSSFFLSYFSRIAWSIVSSYSSLKPNTIQDSLIYSLFFIGYVIVQIPAGLVSDQIKPSNIALISLIGLSITSFISGFSNSIFIEYIASFAMGLSAGWIYPVTIKILTLKFNDKERAVAIGYYSLAWPLSIVLAGLILPFISIRFGWRYSYYMISLLSFIFSLSYLFLDVKQGGNKAKFEIIKDKNVLIISLSGFLFFLAYWNITLYAYKYFLYIGINSYLSGLLYSLLALAGIPATIIAGYIIRNIGVKSSLVIFELLYGVLTLMLSIFFRPDLLALISSLMGFVRFIITPANSTAVSFIGKEKAGSVTGFANFFWQSSGIVSPLVSSTIILRINYYSLWLISGLMIIVSSLIYYMFLKI